MTLNIVCIIVVPFIAGFVLGMTAGLRLRAIDLDTFDAQARIIHELASELSEAKPDDQRYHQE